MKRNPQRAARDPPAGAKAAARHGSRLKLLDAPGA
jgi:hypothetical protein